MPKYDLIYRPDPAVYRTRRPVYAIYRDTDTRHWYWHGDGVVLRARTIDELMRAIVEREREEATDGR